MIHFLLHNFSIFYSLESRSPMFNDDKWKILKAKLRPYTKFTVDKTLKSHRIYNFYHCYKNKLFFSY